MEFAWAKPGADCPLGKAVMHRWAQLSKEQMGVEVKLEGKNKNVAFLPNASADDIDEFGDIQVVKNGICLMGSPVGTDDFRAESVIDFAETKFKDFYDLLENAPTKQIRHKLNEKCGGSKRYKHLMRTQPKEIWEQVGKSGKSAVQIMQNIIMKEKTKMHEKSEFPDRIIKQMELPIDLAGSSIENPKDVMNPALMGGISLAFQGFQTFLPSDDKVHEINWDECQIPTFKRVKKAFETELNKSESLRDLIATAAAGCLLPDLSGFEHDMFVFGNVGSDESNNDLWELKKGQ